MAPQELLLWVFCLVDDQLKTLNSGPLRQRGPDPVLTDSEVITIELVGEYLGLDRDSSLFWHFRHYHAAEFPGLTRIHRTTFVRQAANLWRLKQLLQQRLAEGLVGPTADWLVDSMPVPVCRCSRGHLCRGFRGQAASGYDAAQKQYFYGFRLHARTSWDGVILAFELAPANASDLAMLPELALPSGTTGIGDRNYWSPEMRTELVAAGIRLRAPFQTRKHDPDPARSRRLSRPRWRIESVYSQLAGRYHAKRVWARDLWHLCHRFIRKILSHTVAVWLNVDLGQSPLQLAALEAA